MYADFGTRFTFHYLFAVGLESFSHEITSRVQCTLLVHSTEYTVSSQISALKMYTITVLTVALLVHSMVCTVISGVSALK